MCTASRHLFLKVDCFPGLRFCCSSGAWLLQLCLGSFSGNKPLQCTAAPAPGVSSSQKSTVSSKTLSSSFLVSCLCETTPCKQESSLASWKVDSRKFQREDFQQGTLTWHQSDLSAFQSAAGMPSLKRSAPQPRPGVTNLSTVVWLQLVSAIPIFFSVLFNPYW